VQNSSPSPLCSPEQSNPNEYKRFECESKEKSRKEERKRERERERERERRVSISRGEMQGIIGNGAISV